MTSSLLSFSLTSTPWIPKQLLLLYCSLLLHSTSNWSIVFSWIDMMDSSFLILAFCSEIFSSIFSKYHLLIYWIELLANHLLLKARSVFQNNWFLLKRIINLNFLTNYRIFVKNYSTLLILRIISIFMQIFTTFYIPQGNNKRYF